MEALAISDIVAWSGGRLVQGGDRAHVTSFSTDTRTLLSGACFLALKGPHFDGHDFIDAAVAKGAAAVVAKADRPLSLSPGVAWIAVDDTLRALGRIARGYRLQFSVPVIGVTGSNGKTTTKEMIARVLEAAGPVVATEANQNNEIGVPLTLFRIERKHRAAVVEMGMRAAGEIAELAKIARPTIGVVTNVGPTHIEYLGSLEGVAKAKGELIEALPQDGWAVLNADDPQVRAMAGRTRARVITFGLSHEATVRAERVEYRGLEGSRFILSRPGERAPIIIKLPGRHQVMNALAAAAVAHVLGLDAKAVQEGLIDVRPQMRMNLKRLGLGVILIDDAYNASPLSVRSALLSLGDVQGKRRVAVLGGMLELGALARKAHEEVGRLAASTGVQRLIAVGDEARWIVDGALAEGFDPEQVTHFSDAQAAAGAVERWAAPHDAILVKGSRGFRLEQVSAAIEAYFGSGQEGPTEEIE